MRSCTAEVLEERYKSEKACKLGPSGFRFIVALWVVSKTNIYKKLSVVLDK